MSVDAQRLMDLMTYFHMIWSAPLQIVLALVFLYQTMGVSIFAGFVLMILLIPVNAVIAAISKKFQVIIVFDVQLSYGKGCSLITCLETTPCPTCKMAVEDPIICISNSLHEKVD